VALLQVIAFAAGW